MLCKIGARKSDLARLQAYQVGEALKQAFSDIEIQYTFRSSLGDQNQHDPLWKMPAQGVFTEDFYQDLVDGTFDMVVHSWKDLPVEDRNKTEIFATLPRADERDLLLVKKSHREKIGQQSKVTLMSSSPRRIFHVGEFVRWALPGTLNEVDFQTVRGNIPTRLDKMLSSDEVDGILVAKAALDRLLTAPQIEFQEVQEKLRRVIDQCDWMVLPYSQCPPAAAQGALAIEVRRDDERLKKYLQQIGCGLTLEAVNKERKILKEFGGGCHLKIGVAVLPLAQGYVEFVRGETPAGEFVDKTSTHWHAEHEPPRLSLTEKQLWPLDLEKSRWFERRYLELDQAQFADLDWWLSKADALPEGFIPSENNIVWTAGVQSWKKMAQRGVWVNGCQDSLGEEHLPYLEALLGRPVRWLKFTHTGSHKHALSEVCHSYELIPKEVPPEIGAAEYFYWMSGSSFKRALELFPHLKSAHHSSGPGHTYETLCEYLPPQQRSMFISWQQWKKHFL